MKNPSLENYIFFAIPLIQKFSYQMTEKLLLDALELNEKYQNYDCKYYRKNNFPIINNSDGCFPVKNMNNKPSLVE